MKKKKTSTTSSLHKTSSIPIYCYVQFSRSSFPSNYAKLKNERILFENVTILITILKVYIYI